MDAAKSILFFKKYFFVFFIGICIIGFNLERILFFTVPSMRLVEYKAQKAYQTFKNKVTTLDMGLAAYNFEGQEIFTERFAALFPSSYAITHHDSISGEEKKFIICGGTQKRKGTFFPWQLIVFHSFSAFNRENTAYEYLADESKLKIIDKNLCAYVTILLKSYKIVGLLAYPDLSWNRVDVFKEQTYHIMTIIVKTSKKMYDFAIPLETDITEYDGEKPVRHYCTKVTRLDLNSPLDLRIFSLPQGD